MRNPATSETATAELRKTMLELDPNYYQNLEKIVELRILAYALAISFKFDNPDLVSILKPLHQKVFTWQNDPFQLSENTQIQPIIIQDILYEWMSNVRIAGEPFRLKDLVDEYQLKLPEIAALNLHDRLKEVLPDDILVEQGNLNLTFENRFTIYTWILLILCAKNEVNQELSELKLEFDTSKYNFSISQSTQSKINRINDLLMDETIPPIYRNNKLINPRFT